MFAQFLVIPPRKVVTTFWVVWRLWPTGGFSASSALGDVDKGDPAPIGGKRRKVFHDTGKSLPIVVRFLKHSDKCARKTRKPEISLMVKLAANLSMMFTELPFLDRFAAAAGNGFKAVEFLFPYEAPPEVVADRARSSGVETVIFNFPAGDWGGGERGIGALPNRVKEFRAGVLKAFEYAQALNCPRLHLMAGKTDGLDQKKARRVLTDNIAYAADRAASEDIDILLEPINTRVDIPGYFYDTTAKAMDVIDAVDRANVKLQYDIYHMQIMEGDLLRTIERLLPRIGHMQLAANPGRGEPNAGEINYPWLLEEIDRIGYGGWIGCEYKPAAGTIEGLGWAKPYLK